MTENPSIYIRSTIRLSRDYFINLIIDYNNNRAATKRIADNIDNKLNNNDDTLEETREIRVISQKRYRRMRTLFREYVNFLKSKYTCFKLKRNIVKSH